MNREFLEYYNNELKLLYERAQDFSEQYPGIAERLGGLNEKSMDPGIGGLLEGCAFMAARVQLKLKSEFAEFTTTLLDQLMPNYLAPIPSIMTIQVQPAYDDSNLLDGVTFKKGSLIEAAYIEQEQRVRCEYQLTSDLNVWPLHCDDAEYYAGPAPLQALGLEVNHEVAAGLRLNFKRLTQQPGSGGTDKKDKAPVSDIKIDQLKVRLTGPATDTAAIYEQLFANCRRIHIRYLNDFGDPVFIPINISNLRQIGFGEDEGLFPKDEHVFQGFALLQEYFLFSEKFKGFEIHNIRDLIARINTDNFDIIFEFDSQISRLSSLITSRFFSLHTAVAINLFNRKCSRIVVSQGEFEHHVVADRSRWLEFEVNRITAVFAHFTGMQTKIPVYPVYNLPVDDTQVDEGLYFSSRRLPRNLSSQERRYGSKSNYLGTETYISLTEPEGLDSQRRVRELEVHVLCSNRHLTDQLPIGEAGADFFLKDDTSIAMTCIQGPTPPRKSIVDAEGQHFESVPAGKKLWSVINLLQFNHLGLTDRNASENAGAIRELLTLFADVSNVVTEKQIRAIKGITTRSKIRKIRQENGFNAARGIEITLTFDERSFEGEGVIFLGAVLDRFMASYTSINSFTETVIKTEQRGIIKRWPPRSGSGRLL